MPMYPHTFRARIRRLSVAAFLLLSGLSAAAQTVQDSVRVYFQQGKAEFDPFFEGNGRRIADFITALRSLQRDSTLTVSEVLIAASASPEGAAEVNERLAYARANAIADYLTERIRFDRSALRIHYTPVDWALLEKCVRSDASVPYADEVLETIGTQEIAALRRLRGGRPWAYLYKHHFAALRQTFVVLSVETRLPELAEEDLPEPEEELYEEPVFARLDTWMPYVPLLQLKQGRGIHLKTNLLTWGLLEANIAVEAELTDHLSLSVPVYYTALDWFNVRTKFRVLGTQPELRWWPLQGFKGPFVAAHGSFGWYNVSWKSSRYRYQDRGTRSPAYGGGINAGWKFHLDRHHRWGLEFSVGAGYLYLDYDRFWNQANGAWVDSHLKHYWGIDHVAATLSWRIPVSKSRLL